MYSHEIKQLLELKNYLISSEEYINIIKTSPQICRTRYNSYSDDFESWTKDEYYFKYKVYRKGK